MKKIGYSAWLIISLMILASKVTLAQTPTPSNLPDLVVSTAVMEPMGGDTRMFRIQMTFTNIGRGTLVGGNSGIRLSLYEDPTGDPLNSATIPLESVSLGNITMGSGTSEYYSVTKNLTVGVHKIYARIDVDNTVVESNETNNMSSTTYYVTNDCQWCGNECNRVNTGCPAMPIPAGKVCERSSIGLCSIRNIQIPTPGMILLGDANKDGHINLVDFVIWKKEYKNFIQVPITSFDPNMWKADFNGDQKIDLADYEVWRKAYVNSRKLW